MTNLRALPSVNDILLCETLAGLSETVGRDSVVTWIRSELDSLRAAPEGLSADKVENRDNIAARVLAASQDQQSTRLGRVINATGIILHTGLGRAPVAEHAITAAGDLATAGNVEVLSLIHI